MVCKLYQFHFFILTTISSHSFKPITPRRASGMAKQKIDQILRHPETDDTNSNADRSKKFHERALQKIRQSMALWNKMSSELSSYFLSELPKYRFVVLLVYDIF